MADAVAEGLIRKGGGTEKILIQVEKQFVDSSPKTMDEAVTALIQGADAAGMGVGIVEPLPGQAVKFIHGAGGLETHILKDRATKVIRATADKAITIWEYAP